MVIIVIKNLQIYKLCFIKNITIFTARRMTKLEIQLVSTLNTL